MTETKYVAYLRVSTQKQGYSGLGLEAQREIIHNYLRDTTPISEYVEVESGRKSDRPKLKEALSQCRKESATLIVAKLDRLARSVSFLSNLLESDVEIIFCDFPQANKNGTAYNLCHFTIRGRTYCSKNQSIITGKESKRIQTWQSRAFTG